MKSVTLIMLTICLLHTTEQDSAEKTKISNNENPLDEYKENSRNITGEEKKLLTNLKSYDIRGLMHTEKPSEKYKKKNHNITGGGIKDFTKKPTEGHKKKDEEINDYTNLTDYDIDDVQTFLEYYQNHSLALRDKKKVIQKRFWLPILGILGSMLLEGGTDLLLSKLLSKPVKLVNTVHDEQQMQMPLIPAFQKPKTMKTTRKRRTTTKSNSVEYTDDGTDGQTGTDDYDYDYSGTDITSRRKVTRSIKKGRTPIRDSDNSINIDDEDELYYMQK